MLYFPFPFEPICLPEFLYLKLLVCLLFQLFMEQDLGKMWTFLGTSIDVFSFRKFCCRFLESLVLDHSLIFVIQSIYVVHMLTKLHSFTNTQNSNYHT